MEEGDDSLRTNDQIISSSFLDQGLLSQEPSQEPLPPKTRSHSTSVLRCQEFWKLVTSPVFLCLLLFVSEMTKWFQSPIFDNFKVYKMTSPDSSGLNNNSTVYPQSNQSMKQSTGHSNFCCPKKNKVTPVSGHHKSSHSKLLSNFINKCMINPEFLPSSCTSRRLLVMVNPASGPGKAGSIFKDYVHPLLVEAGINNITLFITTSKASTMDFILQQDLTNMFDGIVVISGDGLIFEVVNGIMKRPDRLQVMSKIPLGIIPGGSGNGLAFSILHANGYVSCQRFGSYFSCLLTTRRSSFASSLFFVVIFSRNCNGFLVHSIMSNISSIHSLTNLHDKS